MRVRLANPKHRLPMPGVPRLFGEVAPGDFSGVEDVSLAPDANGAFWRACIADGSLVADIADMDGEDAAPPA